jgi:hypothetical protein
MTSPSNDLARRLPAIFLLVRALTLACVDPRQEPLRRPADAGEEDAPASTPAPDAGRDAVAPDATVAPDAPAMDAPPADGPARDQGMPPGPDAGPACAAGTHRCGQACLRDDDVASCGQRCDPCPRPSSGSVACMDGQCVLSCPNGYHPCEGVRCASNTDVATCGSTCQPCPDHDNGDSTCDGLHCGVRCRSGFLSCRMGRPELEYVYSCVPPVMDFEDGTSDQFYLDMSSVGADPPVLSMKRAHGGTASLMQSLRAGARTRTQGTFCWNSRLDLVGKRLSLWYYFDGTPPPGAQIGLGIYVGSSSSIALGFWPLVAQQWTKITGTPTDDPQARDTYQIQYDLDVSQAPAGYTATLYVDDIAVE